MSNIAYSGRWGGSIPLRVWVDLCLNNIGFIPFSYEPGKSGMVFNFPEEKISLKVDRIATDEDKRAWIALKCKYGIVDPPEGSSNNCRSNYICSLVQDDKVIETDYSDDIVRRLIDTVPEYYGMVK